MSLTARLGAIALGITATSTFAAGVPTDDLAEVVVTAHRHKLIGHVESSSQGTVTRAQLETRPVLRTGELLETVPGLVVTQHSGDGKANQYFLRGFNLDHGTDLATSVDGVPVNMHTHGHGQGYTDINFVIPELLDRIEYKKGTYYADEGNFSAAGAVDLKYRRTLDDTLLSLTVGEDSYARGLLAGSARLGNGDLLWGLDYGVTDGPWQLAEDLRRVNALVKYSRGERGDGYALTASAYDGTWTSTDQVPERAVTSGLLDRFGFVDPTDGGESHRYALNFEIEKPLGNWNLAANAYALDYQLDLFSNFTYGLDTDNGDQFEQFDDRQAYGVHADIRRETSIGSLPGQLRIGIDSRFDDIGKVGLYLTDDRVRLSAVREDAVQRVGLGFYVEQQVQATEWLRVIAGLRHDRAEFDVDGVKENSGSASGDITSPKLSLVFGPWAETEFFINAGRGFHENDARGTTITVDPADGVTTAERVRPMVRASGAEMGVRTAVLPYTQLALTAWTLDLDSELLYVGDAGATEANRASDRSGVEIGVYVTPREWLTLDADLAWSHARFSELDAAGDHIPGAVEGVASLGVALQHPSGWFGGARFRHFGKAPLIEDNSVRSDPTTLVNLELGYRIAKRFAVSLAAYNLFDSDDNDITYFYESQLPGEGAPVEDRHFHPVEPRTLRLTVETRF
jgi:outer membrane receptor protein involved in Fe transport